MRRCCSMAFLGLLLMAAAGCCGPSGGAGEAEGARPLPMAARQEAAAAADRMAWWREARFGLFIHWGLYAIPAGEWKGNRNHGEWIMHSAQIPVGEYEGLLEQFNPVEFDADRWVRTAKDAGMKYIVITSKHHDGFCLFDSEFTDYDVMSTPFRRDIMQELADACRRHGLRICWYHSIMDWHHPDYLPRRGWEARPAEGADPERYMRHLKNQVRELLTKYGPIGVMWFDGEWEGTWTHEQGQDLYAFVRGIQPDVIVNNRVDKGRSGMAGLTREGGYAGDFGTPEQEIPATGLPDVDWETCMTMNDHWGFNRSDLSFKPAGELIRKLVDIASKGGNFLLNVGPTAEGTFPAPCLERLEAIGRWLDVNGAAIYGTSASPFTELAFGRCTRKTLADGGTRLFLHVFDWPADGRLVVPGIFNEPRGAHLLARPDEDQVFVEREGDALVVRVPGDAPDPVVSVVVLDVEGEPDVSEPPQILAAAPVFVGDLDVSVTSARENVVVRHTLDGSEPGADSAPFPAPLRLTGTTTVSARLFRDGRPVSGTARRTFTRVAPRPAEQVPEAAQGLGYEYYEGAWDELPDFDTLDPVKVGTVEGFSFEPRDRVEHFGFRYRGWVRVAEDGVYTFFTESDDGSRLWIGDRLVVDNGGLHGMQERSGVIALAAGLHPITVTFFERTGGDGLHVRIAGPGGTKHALLPGSLVRAGNP